MYAAPPPFRPALGVSSASDVHNIAGALVCLEKRFNFTLDDLTVTAPAYDCFRKLLSDMQSCNLGDSIADAVHLHASQLDIVDLHNSMRPEMTGAMELWHLHLREGCSTDSDVHSI